MGLVWSPVAESAGEPPLPRPVLLYAGGCRLCRSAARVVVRLDVDEQLALVPLEDDEAASLLASVSEEDRSERWWLVLRDGQALPGDGGAALPLLMELRLTRTLARALDALNAGPALDRLDALVARHRTWIGRLVPNGPAPRRFP